MAVDSSKFNHLSLSQLNELLEDDAKLGQMAQEMDEAQHVQLNKEMTLAGNRSLAEANLLYQPKLDNLKATLTQKYQELQVLMESHQLKKTKLDQQSVNASLETLLALLQAEGAKIEEETEDNAADCSFLYNEPSQKWYTVQSLPLYAYVVVCWEIFLTYTFDDGLERSVQR